MYPFSGGEKNRFRRTLPASARPDGLGFLTIMNSIFVVLIRRSTIGITFKSAVGLLRIFNKYELRSRIMNNPKGPKSRRDEFEFRASDGQNFELLHVCGLIRPTSSSLFSNHCDVFTWRLSKVSCRIWKCKGMQCSRDVTDGFLPHLPWSHQLFGTTLVIPMFKSIWRVQCNKKTNLLYKIVQEIKKTICIE